MKRKILIIILGSLLGVFSVLGSAPAEVHEWQVRSQYRSPVTGQPESVIVWQFTRGEWTDGQFITVNDVANQVQVKAEMFFNQRRVVKIAFDRRVRNRNSRELRNFEASTPAIVSGGLPPVDWFNLAIPFIAISGIQDCFVTTKLASARFVAHLQMRAYEVSLADAEDRGWLVNGSEIKNMLNGKRLFMVELVRVGSSQVGRELMMRQLWAEGRDFWLYEEKGLRRSWLLLE